jgi:hypothetical protein
MIGAHCIPTTFREGDPVVLAEGPYQGSPGVFLRLREDANWAEINEGNGIRRPHPVIWLQHSSAPQPPVTGDSSPVLS